MDKNYILAVIGSFALIAAMATAVCLMLAWILP